MLLVTPCIVRSPVTWRALPSPFFTDVLLKVIVGYCLALKKSGLFRCASRFSLAVSIFSTLSTTLKLLLDGSASSSVKLPSGALNRPAKKLTFACLMRKTADEWTGSTLYDSAAKAGTAKARARAATAAASEERFIRGSFRKGLRNRRRGFGAGKKRPRGPGLSRGGTVHVAPFHLTRPIPNCLVTRTSRPPSNCTSIMWRLWV